jgi:copper chaperone CopZ
MCRKELIMKAATIQLGTLTCPSCMQKIESAVKGLDGVEQDTVKVLFNASKVKLNFNEDRITIDQIENAITKMGYEVKKSSVKSA